MSETWTGNMAAWSFTTEKSGGTFTDGYDAEDRFRRFIQSSQSNDIYLARSDIGNISDVEINSVSNLRSYSNAHELTTVDGTTQTFDDDGNLTLSHHGITVNWDDANRLTQTVVPPTATAGIEGTNDYGYDADGKRVWKKITRSGAVAEHTVYVYAGPNCIAEYNSGALAASPEQEYVYAGGIDSLVLLSRNSDADRYVATRNQQWSITALADISNGTVQERYTYGAFGKRTILAPDGVTVRTASSYNMPYGYTSRRHDPESDLMYFRARHYDPSTGEFTSRDPLEYVDGMSMMRGHLDLNAIDPKGTLTIIPIRARLGDLDCRNPAGVIWDFRVDATEHCSGWIVQEVRMNVRCRKCESPDCCCDRSFELGEVFSYWEAWKVEEDEPYHTLHDEAQVIGGQETRYTDAALAFPLKGHCGYNHQRGEVRFYCDDEIGDLAANPAWERDRTYISECVNAGTGLLLGTEKDARPDFWDVKPVQEGPVNRAFYMSYNCCRGCDNNFMRAWASPSSGAGEIGRR